MNFAEYADSRPVLSVAEYATHVMTMAPPVRSVRRPLGRCLGRVLAKDVDASIAIPPFDNSAMDGFAVRAADVPTLPGARIPVVDRLPAGAAPLGQVPGGAAVRIMTGAALPAGLDTVIPIENVRVGDGEIQLVAALEPGRHVRGAGEDVQPGGRILSSGTRLGASQIAAAAAVGLAELPVLRRPRVAVIATGTELVTPGDDLGPAQIYDSNSTYLRAAAVLAGAHVVSVATVSDDIEALREQLTQAASRADLVVAAGGISAGDYDIVRAVLAPLPGALFAKVRMQPGKPQGCARWPDGGGVPVVALPGNPVSVAVSFAVFVEPMLAAAAGRPPAPRLRALATRGWASPAGRQQFAPVRIDLADDGRLQVAPASRGGSASHLVTSLAQANGLAIVAADQTAVEPGAVLEVIRLP